MSVTWHFVCVIVRLSIVLYRTCLFFFFFFDQIRPVFRKNLTPRHKVYFILSIVINYRNTQQKIMQNQHQTKPNQTKKKILVYSVVDSMIFFYDLKYKRTTVFLKKRKVFHTPIQNLFAWVVVFFLFVCLFREEFFDS